VTTSANVPGVAWTAQRDGATVATGSGATFSFTPADNGTYAVTAAATWSGGTVSASATIAVNNVAPTATFAAPATGAVATDFTIALIAPIDPGMADATAGFEYAFDCGSGYGSFGTTVSTSCTAAGEEGFILVGAKIRDHDGAETEYIEFIWVGVSGDSTVTASAPPADRNPAIRHAVAFLTRRLPGTSPDITSWVRPRVPVANQARKGSSGQG